ncbi:MAG: NlpC/P60 family protein [Eubacteriales bacterium]|nr:NlpC/P60 family protein [Eubacteriales bacterium]
MRERTADQMPMEEENTPRSVRGRRAVRHTAEENRRYFLTTAGIACALLLTSGGILLFDGHSAKVFESEQAAEAATLAMQEEQQVADLGEIHFEDDSETVAVSSITKEVIGAINLFKSQKSEDEYIAEANKADEIYADYENLGIANVSDTLNIRKSPEEDADLAGRLPAHAVCEVVSEDGGWSYIVSGDVEGYVKSEYLATGAQARLLAQEAIQTEATVSVEEDALTVRVAPSTDADAITTIPNGQTMDVISKLGNWVKVQIDSEIAYVSAKYVTLSQSLRTAISISELIYGDGVTDIRAQLCSYAMQFLGNPYVWGGTSLTNGADCSGFVQSVFANYGIYLPRVAAAQANAGTTISQSEAQPGDLFFYSGSGGINHVAIYIGNGQVINASNEKYGITIYNSNYRTVTKVVRVLET